MLEIYFLCTKCFFFLDCYVEEIWNEHKCFVWRCWFVVSRHVWSYSIGGSKAPSGVILFTRHHHKSSIWSEGGGNRGNDNKCINDNKINSFKHCPKFDIRHRIIFEGYTHIFDSSLTCNVSEHPCHGFVVLLAAAVDNGSSLSASQSQKQVCVI